MPPEQNKKTEERLFFRPDGVFLPKAFSCFGFLCGGAWIAVSIL